MNDTGKKQLVLAVDDQPQVLKFIEIGLKLRGFEVISTVSGKEALKFIKLARPDIMLLDMHMPEMDGFEVLRQLRTFSKLPVIVVSAGPGSRGDAMYLGADDFLPKPFHPDEMVSRIRSLLNRS